MTKKSHTRLSNDACDEQIAVMQNAIVVLPGRLRVLEQFKADVMKTIMTPKPSEEVTKHD